MAETPKLNDIGQNQQTQQPFVIMPDQLFGQHLLIVGATGSGKSTTAVRLITSLREQNQTAIIIDPTGEYTSLPSAIVAHLGRDAFIDYTQLDAETLGPLLGITSRLGLEKLAQAMISLKIQANVKKQPGIYRKLGQPTANYQRARQQLYDYPQPYEIDKLPQQLQQECLTLYPDERADFDVLGQVVDQTTFQKILPEIQRLRSRLADPQLQALLRLPIMDEQMADDTQTQYDIMFYLRLFSSLPAQHRCLVVDASALAEQIGLGKLVISLLAKGLLQVKRSLTNTVPVVLVVDEAHRYLTDKNVDQDGLSRVAREGRKYQLRLLLTTQSPLDIPNQLLGQFGNWMVHRLNTTTELAGIPGLTQFANEASQLPIGVAILTGLGITQTVKLKINAVTN